MGTLLLQHAAERAHAAGLGTLVCRVVPPDERALEVLHRSGLVVAEREVPGGRELELATDPGEEGLARFEERERAATAASLVPLFRPASVALIGASRTPGSIGRTVLERLLAAGFAGAIYPVNPSAHAVGGIRAYPAVTAIPDAVDLAVIAVPAAAVPAVVDDCATKGVRALVVLSAGFAELGASGAAVQAELVARVRGHGMRMVGPNCIGVFNADPEVRLNATFGRALPPAGGVAMSSQSGAMGIAITDYAARLGIGLSTFVSVGNKADVSGNDLLQYWESDPGTNVIALYLESFGNPRKFSRIARRVGRRKPILAVKSGRTGAGSRAARSHTAALAGSDVAADALFRQAGIVRLDTLEELFDVASLLTGQPLPASNRVAIITNAGGPGILCADACEANGLTLPTLSGPTLSALRAVLPPTAGLANPIDMIASASPAQYETVAREVLLDPAVDALIAINISVGEARGEAFAGAVRRAAEHAHAAGAHKPTLSCFMSPDAPPAALRGEHATLGEQALGPIPAYRFPEAPARALARAVRYHDWRERAPGRVRAPEGVDREAARAAVAGARA
ncbi:MAG: GNAT family N-acetyltransferase, partial [Chloroflexi bacterium]|nr:GNAT family N-acetyltransferase [Chloroflexota bacterium]